MSRGFFNPSAYSSTLSPSTLAASRLPGGHQLGSVVDGLRRVGSGQVGGGNLVHYAGFLLRVVREGGFAFENGGCLRRCGVDG